MRLTSLWPAVLIAVGCLVPIPSAAQQVVREEMAGVRNLARIESTVACAGAITPKAVAEIKKAGYGALINLRLATETGADIDGHTAAAKAAGIRYIHIPFSASTPEPAAVDAFLKAMAEPGVAPAFIH